MSESNRPCIRSSSRELETLSPSHSAETPFRGTTGLEPATDSFQGYCPTNWATCKPNSRRRDGLCLVVVVVSTPVRRCCCCGAGGGLLRSTLLPPPLQLQLVLHVFLEQCAERPAGRVTLLGRAQWAMRAVGELLHSPPPYTALHTSRHLPTENQSLVRTPVSMSIQ